MANTATLDEKYALYYPYIHLRDANWTKATLLWFGQIRRIAPENFIFKDRPEIAELTSVEGPAGPLIQSARLHDENILDANRSLLQRIHENLAALQAKFAHAVTPMKLLGIFEIYRYKFLEDPGGSDVITVLLQSGLAWPSTRRENPEPWVCVHPEFGSALMSYLALAIAKNEGLDIVTDTERLHESLIAEKEENVFDKLLGLPETKHGGETESFADDLGQLIVTTQFDVSVLDATDIRKLLDKKQDLRSFREKVAQIAGDLPSGVGPEERIERLNKKRDELIEEWKERSSFFPKSLRDTFVEVGEDEIAKKIVEGLPELGAAVIAGSVTAHVVGAAPGLGISIVAGAGIKMWRNRKSPLKYLSRVESAINRGVKVKTGSLYLPQWSKFEN